MSVVFMFQNHQLILPSPRLNDSMSLGLNTHIDRAMDGTFHAFKKQPVPLKRFSLFFEHMNRPLVIQTIEFLKLAMGKQVTYTDYNRKIWAGKILTEPFTSTHVAIRNNQFNLEFEGKAP